ncbi:hypothetical protein E9228_002783 [Curtobacterium flaccumfaciens]|uniref:Uncharacterized protein n=1 Tax=Curtobacterium salicis TaxID=1779862 RepID=A0ABX0TEB6_9MICO|nr:hypothetical protein [Curtobacterium sp. WW7]NII42125.1 hypothetical protein [Curtobacterium sp. WW7]
MNLSDLRALLIAHAYEPTTKLDRIDIKRAFGEVTGVDVMFTDGTVAFLAAEQPTRE